MPDSPPAVALPDDLKQKLEQVGLLDKFQRLPPSHVREYVKWIDEAKKPETRARRIEGAIARFTERSA